ncbi:fungal chitosanase of glycosyl hydrolase group 75-domain-containing protein [Mycena polygramma]|nr:fungal chitosanase of glycosyl hydrolase group 75-domain-containing protein [Mycena polygramma]
MRYTRYIHAIFTSLAFITCATSSKCAPATSASRSRSTAAQNNPAVAHTRSTTARTHSTANPVSTSHRASSSASSAHHNPASNIPFAADPSINVAAIYSAVKSAKKQPLDQDRTYLSTTDKGGQRVHIYGDWLTLGRAAASGRDLDSRSTNNGVSAFHFIADMDTDCDGLDGNPDGQSATSFGHLDASKVPFFVLPLPFTQAKEVVPILKANALGAVICDGKMFYGIYGDQDGDSPPMIGEASILMGRTCFPGTTIDGAHGHSEIDVAYIVFGTKVPSGVGDKTIDIGALKSLGDAQVKALQTALGIKALS